mgnify:CR=1 FL=1
MKHHQRTEGINDEWLTPPEILAPLGRFTLDPCAAKGSKCAQINVTPDMMDGLKFTWTVDLEPPSKVRIWLNPPFNRYERPKWMRKMADHANGIMLIPAATETKAFYDYVWSKADAVCFLKGRPHFHYVTGERAKANCGCSIALVAYGESNATCLESSLLGKTFRLKL